MKYLFAVIALLTFVSCEQNKSTNELVDFFYPIAKESKFYVYRDVVNGLDEQIHRIYPIEDSKGKHFVVEIYTGEGRIIEAYNYNIDSLNLIDHMVVNGDGKKQQADIVKNQLFPMNLTEEAYFASRFPGFYDSTLILREVKRTAAKTAKIKLDVMNNSVETIVFDEYIRQTLYNPFKKTENILDTKAKSYFAKGYGLVEWHDEKKKHHYVLEQILDEKEGIKLIGR